jgi:uncharacterized cupin superfamily protein
MSKLRALAPAGEAVWEPIPADKILAGAPETRLWVQYEGPDGLAAGEWEASPGKWRIAYTEWEWVVVLAGHCIITGDDGTVIKAGPGDAFVIEPGFVGTWEVTETMRKRWVIKE